MVRSWIHDEGDEEGVARGPGGGVVVEEAEFEGEVGALGGDGGVDAAGVEFEPVELVGREDGDGAVGGGAELEGALGAVVGEERGAEELGEGAGGVAAEGFHLPEAVLRGDEALGDDEVVERGGVDVGDTVGVALDGDGSGEAGDGDGAVELREGVAHGVAGPDAGAEEGGDEKNESDVKAMARLRGRREGRGALLRSDVRRWRRSRSSGVLSGVMSTGHAGWVKSICRLPAVLVVGGRLVMLRALG